MKKKSKPQFHKLAPRKLRGLWRTFGTYEGIAKYLGVNIAYVYKALMQGKHPVREDVRHKFGLPRRPRKPRNPAKIKVPLPSHILWWRGLSKDFRTLVILKEYHQWKQRQANLHKS